MIVYWHRWQKSLVPLTLLLMLALSNYVVQAQPQQQNETGSAPYVITGQLFDEQGQPVPTAVIHLGEVETESQENGAWILALAELPADSTNLVIERPHFASLTLTLDTAVRQQLQNSGTYNTGTLTLARHISIGFWVATLAFILVLMLIAFEKLHSTTAALVGVSLIFVSTFIGRAFASAWFIFDFEQALRYINWEVIFLVMAMMIIIAIIEETGVFQWMAFQAYRLSRGRLWLLVLILMLITAVASALLDNFTTMLLMTPISLQIGIALGINPLALIIPEVLASNVGGISTLIGTPTNILIGAYADIGFSDFLANQTVGVLIALAFMAAFVLYHYRKELFQAGSGISHVLYERLEKNARIEEPRVLAKSGLVFLLVIVGFVIGERYHIVPAVPALLGATLLLVWLKPDVQKMIKAVDWTTLLFFMALFIVVGAVQEVGLISTIAQAVSNVVGDSLPLAVFFVVFGAGTMSVFIANIPLAASLLPVVEFLSGNIPGANSKVLYYALSMGAAMGGNGFLISAEANLVTAGITAQADAPISFKAFMKVGLPVTYLTLLAGFLWLAIRFAIFGS
ncbi:MAG: citrate transporter [Ardenticatenaceae bacterium]|nr:MAG: citrate transporter [Ardenticatenaceae bacterium]